MRLAVHASALQDIFGGKSDLITANAILSSRISLTATVLEQYQNTLSNDQNFLNWFAASQAAGRFSLHFPQQAPAKVQAADSIINSYATAAYFAGGKIAINPATLTQQTTSALREAGIEPLCPRTRISGTIPGDNPFFSVSTRANGNLTHASLDPFFNPESRVLVYDKYINANSLDLLCHIAQRLPTAAELIIIHAGKNQAHLKQTSDILTTLQAANTSINVICKTASSDFLKLAHDRYIFLGRRIQIIFSVGLPSSTPTVVSA